MSIDRESALVRAFPSYEDVFVDADEWHSLVFLPLVAVNTSLVLPGVDQWLSFVQPWDNGDYTGFENAHRDATHLRFSLVGQRFRYDGPRDAFPRFAMLSEWWNEAEREFSANERAYTTPITFQEYMKSAKKQRDEARGALDFDHRHYIEQQISYRVTRAGLRQHGVFLRSSFYTNGSSRKEEAFLDRVGGEPEWSQDDATPLDDRGEPLKFIAQLTGYNYVHGGADSLLLFFDQRRGQAVQVMEFT